MPLKIIDIKPFNAKADIKSFAIIHLHKLRPFGSVAPGWEVNLWEN